MRLVLPKLRSVCQPAVFVLQESIRRIMAEKQEAIQKCAELQRTHQLERVRLERELVELRTSLSQQTEQHEQVTQGLHLNCVNSRSHACPTAVGRLTYGFGGAACVSPEAARRLVRLSWRGVRAHTRLCRNSQLAQQLSQKTRLL